MKALITDDEFKAAIDWLDKEIKHCDSMADCFSYEAFHRRTMLSYRSQQRLVELVKRVFVGIASDDRNAKGWCGSCACNSCYEQQQRDSE